MSNRNNHLLLLIGIFLSLAAGMDNLKAQESPTSALDKYFKLVSMEPSMAKMLFMEGATVTTITYNQSEQPIARNLSVAGFLSDLQAVDSGYSIKMEPVVLLNREHKSTTRIFCSVYARFAEDGSTDTLLSRSMQSFTFVEFENQWKITSISIQNEHPSIPIPSKLWPQDLTYDLFKGQSPAPAAEVSAYDPNKVYTAKEVDEPPVYTGSEKEFRKKLSTWGVDDANMEGRTPFTVLIEEDGSAKLDYVNDLSGPQIEKAKSMVESMSLWYPAIVDKASVKCRLIFYINE